MAGTILAIGKLSFAAIGVAVGTKLASDVRRHGGVGLHLVALAAISTGGLGMLGIALGELQGSHAVVLSGEVGMRAGMLLLCVFVAGTFRPGAVGVVLAGLCGACLLAASAWDVSAQRSLVAYDYGMPSSHANQLSIAMPFAWSMLESALLWVRGRRRLAFGLAAPALVERYLLWTVTTACFVVVCLLAMLAGEAQAAGRAALADGAHALRGLLYLVISAAVWRGILREAEPARAASSVSSR